MALGLIHKAILGLFSFAIVGGGAYIFTDNLKREKTIKEKDQSELIVDFFKNDLIEQKKVCISWVKEGENPNQNLKKIEEVCDKWGEEISTNENQNVLRMRVKEEDIDYALSFWGLERKVYGENNSWLVVDKNKHFILECKESPYKENKVEIKCYPYGKTLGKEVRHKK